MKTLLTLMAFLIITSGSIAQTSGFKNNYFDASGNIGTDICQTSDGGYMMCGMHSIKTGGGSREYRAVFLKTDSTGKTQWIKTLSSNFGPTNIRQAKDGGYMVFGGISTTSDNLYGKANLLKLNSTGDSLWMKSINGIYSAWPSNWKTNQIAAPTNWKRELIATPDSGFFVVGNCNRFSRRVVIYKYNSKGDSLMCDTVYGNTLEVDFQASLCQNGGLILAIPYTGSMRLLQFSAAGARVQNTYMPIANTLMTAPVICQTNDGKFMLAVTPPAGSSKDNLYRIGANGNLLWSKSIPVLNTAAVGACLQQLADARIAFWGSQSNDQTGYVNGSTTFTTLDTAGNLLNTNTLVNDMNMNQQLFSCYHTSDDGFALCGHSVNTLTNAAGIVLIKTDGNGYSFSTISGRVFLDTNHNCIPDNGEKGLNNQQVKLMPGGILVNTDSLGNYSFKVLSGNYTVSTLNGPYTATVCPGGGSYAVSVNALGKIFADLNFADTALTSCPDLSVTLGTCGLGLCYRNTYTINYANKGLVADTNASVTIKPDNALIFLSSSIPWVYTAPNNYTFNLGQLNAGQTGSFQIIDSVSCAATNGTTACVQARIFSSMQECDTTNNHASDCRQITSSLDPNEMLVAVQNTQSPVFVNQQVVSPTDSLQYFIRFQNTGTGAAVNISISDTLGASLDASSVVLGSSSSPCSLINKNGILTFNFAQVMLPDSISNPNGSTGFVSFYVQQKKGNAPGTMIHNNASIVFDYNKPVATNKTLNYIPLITGINEANSGGLMRVYPNPSSGDHFNIELSSFNPGKEILVVLYDLEGRETYSKIIITGGGTHPIASVDPSHTLSPGIYLVVATSDNRIYKQKIVIE